MPCCGKIAKKGKAIAVGYYRFFRKIKCESTDERIRICQKCPKNYWIKRTLWCSICKCFIPAKARVKEEKCPKGKW